MRVTILCLFQKYSIIIKILKTRQRSRVNPDPGPNARRVKTQITGTHISKQVLSFQEKVLNPENMTRVQRNPIVRAAKMTSAPVLRKKSEIVKI